MKKDYKKMLGILISVAIMASMLGGCATSKNTSANITENTQKENSNGDNKNAIDVKGEANTQGVTKKWLDIAYADKSQAQKLDIYLPNSGDGPFPVIVAFHGGGFFRGDKASKEVNPQFTELNRGYAVVSVNYRLTNEGSFPDPIYDAKAAIRFIKVNASKYNLNSNKIAAWGESAGGYLSAMLGTSAGVKTLEDLSMGNAEQSSNVQAVVDFYGPINFSTMDEQNKESGIASKVDKVLVNNGPDSFASKYMGADITTIPDKVKQADPTTYISANTSPFFIENGTLDPNVATQQSVDFAADLEKVLGKDKVTYFKLEGAGHGGKEFETKDNLDKVYRFIDKYLK
ncbi:MULTISPECIES: alpha/beta hydrolase [Clostridium]|uniref:Alpha/beta hydrolase n=1 Tax=Clostridium frigoriphilum TaxID=443253 RepID=A0ABU7UWK1_9CLOT|nr:alpha/beta hydrolase [Clostridium sp. DSM 17811]MBU3102214.1 alpha/beta hydrolase [Clostridium sp. DSM 17811]